MTAAKLERRRQLFTRFWLAAVPVVVLLVVAVVLLTVYGGQGSGVSVGRHDDHGGTAPGSKAAGCY